jgi:hypothetical protein
MLPVVVVRVIGRRALTLGALALGVGAIGFAALDVREVTHPGSSVRAPWVETCAARMERARVRLADDAAELAHAEVRQAWSLHAAWAELRLDPQYSARIEFRTADDSAPVFDWEETATPVAGSFALHRHVGRYDLTVVADDTDERGLMFAAHMQPLLDQCVMEAQEQ